RFLDLLPPVPHKREAIALHRLNRFPASNCTLSPQATILRWQGVPFTASHLEPLSRVIPKIHELILVDAELTPGEWPDLSQFTSLVELNLGVCFLPLQFMQQVARRPQLNTLKLKR